MTATTNHVDIPATATAAPDLLYIDALRSLANWAERCHVDLSHTSITRGEVYSWDVPCILRVDFHQSRETRTNFQAVKFGLGGGFNNDPEFGADKAPDFLQAMLHLPSNLRPVADGDDSGRDFIEVRWFGAYECKVTSYNCTQADFKPEPTE